MTYQLTTGDTILRLADNAFIPPDPANTDYAAYLEWVEAGNTPEPAPEPAAPVELTTEQKLEAAGLTVAELRELFGLPAPELEPEPVDGQA
jgi:hypothetical protein